MKFKFLSVAAAALMFAACNEPLNDAAEVETSNLGGGVEEETIVSDNGAIVLGEKLPNPYSLDNMRKAIEEYNKSGLSKSTLSTDIKPTHYYIKFKPKNEDDINKLESDTTIFFYSYPLDYEVLVGGSNYHDPELPDSVPTYQYCAVEVGHKLPAVEYEILEELYILEDVNVYENNEEDKILEKLSKNVKADYWEELEEKAEELVGLNMEKSISKKKWKPKGYIRYEDIISTFDKNGVRNGSTSRKIIPLEGVPVHMRKSMFVGHQCCTDANGYYSFDMVRVAVDYTIRWKRSNFKVRPNTGWSAAETTLKKDTKHPCNVVFYKGEDAWKYASVFRGLHYYYYGNIDGLSRPKDNNLTVRASNKEPHEDGYYSAVPGTSDIHVYIKDRNSDDIFCTTVHEVGHCVHKEILGIISFGLDCSTTLAESWARGVSWYITKKMYPNFDLRERYERSEYTGIMQDLMDGIELNSYFYKDCSYYDDKVSGYTITQIEATLKGCSTLAKFINKLKNNYENATENNLDALRDYWNGN